MSFLRMKIIFLAKQYGCSDTASFDRFIMGSFNSNINSLTYLKFGQNKWLCAFNSIVGNK